ncbi:MAG: hypothetical protein DSZ27_05455 [Thiomicrospira sp.]|nr:MAG: hypothetical protein DSZ27_05455 [Thiomicrospira sp.]
MMEETPMKLVHKTVLTTILCSPLTVLAEVHPGKVLHDEANCMKCHSSLGYNKPNLKKMAPNNYQDLQKAVAYCDQNLNVGWFDEEREEVVDYLNKTYYQFSK